MRVIHVVCLFPKHQMHHKNNKRARHAKKMADARSEHEINILSSSLLTTRCLHSQRKIKRMRIVNHMSVLDLEMGYSKLHSRSVQFQISMNQIIQDNCLCFLLQIKQFALQQSLFLEKLSKFRPKKGRAFTSSTSQLL